MLDECAVGGKSDEQFVDEMREHHRAKIPDTSQHARIAGRAGIKETTDDIAELRILFEPASHRAAKAAGPDDHNAMNVDARSGSAVDKLAFSGSPSGEGYNAENSGAPN